MDDAISMVGIEKTLRGHHALRGVDLVVRRGSLTGLIGLNGAGKTTTLRILLGLLPADRGDSTILGTSSRELHRIADRVGVQLHGGGLDPSLTVRETLELACLLAGRPSREVVDRAIERSGIERLAKRKAGKLSAGERQKLALARAMLFDPEVLILDEPLTHLDPGAAEAMIRLLRAAADRGTAVLLSSHQLEYLDRVSDHVLFLHRGRVIADGEPRQILDDAGLDFVVGATPIETVERILREAPILRSFERVSSDGARGEWRVKLQGPHAHELNDRLVRGGCAVDALIPDRRSLHDLFLERVRESEGAAP